MLISQAYAQTAPTGTGGMDIMSLLPLILMFVLLYFLLLRPQMRRTKEQYPWVGAMFLWNLNFAILRARSGQPRHEQASFGILNADGSPRPSFLAIQEYLAQLR